MPGKTRDQRRIETLQHFCTRRKLSDVVCFLRRVPVFGWLAANFANMYALWRHACCRRQLPMLVDHVYVTLSIMVLIVDVYDLRHASCKRLQFFEERTSPRWR